MTIQVPKIVDVLAFVNVHPPLTRLRTELDRIAKTQEISTPKTMLINEGSAKNLIIAI
jgi:hypothetical protein